MCVFLVLKKSVNLTPWANNLVCINCCFLPQFLKSILKKEIISLTTDGLDSKNVKRQKYILSWDFSFVGWVGLGVLFYSSKMLGQVPLTRVLLSNRV